MSITKQAFTLRTAAAIAFIGAATASSAATAPTVPVRASTVSAAAAVAATVRAAGPTVAQAIAAVAAAKPVAKVAATMAAIPTPKDLGAKIKWVPVRHGAKTLRTVDEASRILLVQTAAKNVGLESVGLSFHDVYGVIEAETSWVPRDGMGKNGVTSLGLAQFEPRTAKGLGLNDPQDPVQAVHAAALYMKHAAVWSARKIAHLKLSPQQYAAKLREGVSIYYNLSIKGRNKWDGLNTAALPVETQRHINNVRTGVQEALQLAGAIRAA